MPDFTLWMALLGKRIFWHSLLGLSRHLTRSHLSFVHYTYHNAAFFAPNTPFFPPLNPSPLAFHIQHLSTIDPTLEVVKAVEVPPVYPPILMANRPRLPRPTWLLPGTSTYQVRLNQPKAFKTPLHILQRNAPEDLKVRYTGTYENGKTLSQ